MTCGDLSVFTEERITYREDTVPFVVAPIRVDVILGLPFILGLDVRGLFDREGFPTMTFYHDGQTLSLRAKSTNRHWEAPSACAARLLSPREIRPRRFQPAKPALNAEGIYTAKHVVVGGGGSECGSGLSFSGCSRVFFGKSVFLGMERGGGFTGKNGLYKKSQKSQKKIFINNSSFIDRPLPSVSLEG
ncbi:TPA_asm: oncoid [Powellomyces chytrid fungus MELD virus 4]|nr:TPA_asm: oncoid [Powellomyces chytrid fungus MELD virus 4]